LLTFTPNLKIPGMNTIYKSLGTALFACLMLISSTESKAQALAQGGIAIDTYYGVLSVSKAFIEDNNEDNDNYTYSYVGPVGGRFEYMASDKVGLGFDANYTIFTADWDTYDSASATTYHYTGTRKITRFMPRFNIHFGASESFDAYFGVGIGYRGVTYKITTNDPDGGDEGDGLLPWAARICLGGRYYFTENIGVNFEMGVGGGTMLHLGASFKF
jgi:opacity protein-like surface antigen